MVHDLKKHLECVYVNGDRDTEKESKCGKLLTPGKLFGEVYLVINYTLRATFLRI